MRDRLIALDEAGTPIRVAIIGAGRFGSMMVAQVLRAPGMSIDLVCDLDVEKAFQAFELAGIPRSSVGNVDTAGGANDAMRRRRPAVTAEPNVVIESEADVVVEATGHPDAGALHAFQSITAGKHVVMVTVEADVVAGPHLAHTAKSAGVVYSLAYGDQPAIIEELFDWAVSMGFEVVAAGKGTKYLPKYRHSTPDEALEHYGTAAAEEFASAINPRMYNSFLDGTKSAVEMCAVANMTGLKPDVPGMHFPGVGVSELTNVLRPREAGGILERSGVVEVVSSLRRDGTQIEDALRWGVYVVITTDSAYLRSCMNDYGIPVDDSGAYGVMYRPFHLVGMEAPVSIAKAVLYGEPTGAPKARVGEVAAAAKRRLEPGEVLDGEGGYTTYGLLLDAAEADRQGVVPIGLSHGATILKPVEQDALLTAADVDLPTGGFASELREVQSAESGRGGPPS